MMVQKLIKRLSYTFVACAALYSAWYVWMGFPVAGYNFCTGGWKVMDESDRVQQSADLFELDFPGEQQQRTVRGEPRLNEQMFREMIEEIRSCAKQKGLPGCNSIERTADQNGKRQWFIRREDGLYLYGLGLDSGSYRSDVGYSDYHESRKSDKTGKSSQQFANFHSVPGCSFNGHWGAG